MKKVTKLKNSVNKFVNNDMIAEIDNYFNSYKKKYPIKSNKLVAEKRYAIEFKNDVDEDDQLSILEDLEKIDGDKIFLTDKILQVQL